MTDKPKDNPMAFPCSSLDGYFQNGMELRDYFAAKAMQGILVCSDGLALEDKPMTKNQKNVSRIAYILADAMLEARKATNGKE